MADPDERPFPNRAEIETGPQAVLGMPLPAVQEGGVSWTPLLLGGQACAQQAFASCLHSV